MKHKLSIIGFGGMGQWHYENITARIKGIEVIGAYDIKEEVRNKIKDLNLKAYDNIGHLLSDNQTDIVLVSTPNNFHMEYCVAALKAGKNVVCEKPCTMNTAELDKILEAKNKEGKFFTVHQNRRWDVDYAIVKNVINNNIIGKPYFINSRLFGCKGLPGDWRSSIIAGGGMLYDWSIHLIDQILCLIDSKPINVFAELINLRFTEVDDCNRLTIVFENGVRAQITVDTWCYAGDSRWQISGDDGTLLIYDWFGKNGKLIKANIKTINWEEGVIFTSNGRSKTMAPRPVEELQELPLPIPEKDPKWEEFYENIIEVLENKSLPIVTTEQVRKAMTVLDACFLSAKENRVVTL